MITITEKASDKIRESLTESERQADGLRIRVVGGGCSGLQYKLDLDVEKRGDKIFEHTGARVYVDRKSYLYINGTTLDWRDSLQATGFHLDNPNVKRTCGCGESFIV
jgi:iron-sulfur cluster assembly protein